MDTMNQNTDPIAIALCKNESGREVSESCEFKVDIEAYSQDIVSLHVTDISGSDTKDVEPVKKESFENTTEDSNEHEGIQKESIDISKSPKLPKSPKISMTEYDIGMTDLSRKARDILKESLNISNKELHQCFSDLISENMNEKIPKIPIGHNTQPKARKNDRKCCVPKCTTTGRGFYSVPEHPKRRQEWFNACKLPPTIKIKEYMYVCWKHFSPSDFKNEIDDESIAQLRFGHLKLNAVPSQNLPEDSDPITINVEISKKVQNRCEICEKDLKSRSKLLVHQRSCMKRSEKGKKETLDKELTTNIGTKIKEVIMETSSVDLGFQNNEKIENLWRVKDASVFLKYCCPECEFVNQDLQSFTDHAIANHKDALVLFPHEQGQSWQTGFLNQL
jgi:hypothetical protein